MSRPFGVLLLGFFLGALPSPAVAQPTPPATQAPDPVVLKKQGDDAMLKLRYQDALTYYEQAYELSKDPALHYNSGRALEAIGRFPEALRRLEMFARDAPPDLRARVPKLDELIAQLRSRVATLSVKVSPEGATVRLGDAIIGKSPLVSKEVNAGKARLEITLDGFEPLARDLDLTGGKKTELDLKLVPRDKQGTLVVTSSTSGAEVTVDGEPAGQVPAELRLAAGSHVITVDHGGFEEEERTVVVVTGARKEVDVTLRELPAAYETWWFWTLLGVPLVAGGAVGLGYALTTEASPTSGTIEPGQIPVDPARASVRIAPASIHFVLRLD